MVEVEEKSKTAMDNQLHKSATEGAWNIPSAPSLRDDGVSTKDYATIAANAGFVVGVDVWILGKDDKLAAC